MIHLKTERREYFMKFVKLIIIIFVGTIFFYNTCFAQDLPEQTPVRDPLEGYNRVMFTINDKLDKYFMKPVAEFYNKIMPAPLNLGVDNVFNNLLGTQLIINDSLQANFYQSTLDTWRTLIDSTVGVGGVFDVGERIGLPFNMNGFGLTMTKWGYTNSNYFVLPFLGPSTIRDAIGTTADVYSGAPTYFDNMALRNSLYATYLLDKRAQLLRFQNVYEEMAIDPYIFQRTAYLQHRDYLVQRVSELNNPYTAENTKAMKRDYYIVE